MSLCRVLCCWKRVFAMTSAFSWQNSISLCPASFCITRPNLPVTPGVSWLPTFAFQSPIIKRTSFWGISSLFFFFFLLLFFFTYNIVLVLPYINMHLLRVYMCSQSWTPPPTSLPIPSLWVIPVHQPQASCIMHQNWTGDLTVLKAGTCSKIKVLTGTCSFWNLRERILPFLSLVIGDLLTIFGNTWQYL